MAKKEINKDKIKKNGKKFVGEFKEFISKGNVIDLAVGVIIGGAFGKIVTSLVDNILMPLIGLIIGGIDFSGLSIKVKDATISYGLFIQNVIDFLIVSFCIFLFIKIINKIATKNKKEEKEAVAEVVEAEKQKDEEMISVLEEIRDLLKEKNK